MPKIKNLACAAERIIEKISFPPGTKVNNAVITELRRRDFLEKVASAHLESIRNGN